MEPEELLNGAVHAGRQGRALGGKGAAERQHALLETVEEQERVIAQAGTHIRMPLPDAVQRGDEALEIVLHQNGDQVLLGREVVVHAGLGDAGALGEIGVAEGRVASRPDQVLRLAEDDAARALGHKEEFTY